MDDSTWADETADLTATDVATVDPAPLAPVDGEFTVAAGEWMNLPDAVDDDLMVINMGPQHPSTHGVLRMLLTMDGEVVVDNQPVIGYLHTGIEKNAEYRPWTQGVTYVTRMDYLSNFFNELAYCLAVEKLLGITGDVPERAQAIRVLLTELNRITSHQVALATGGLELGALSAMIYGFREREGLLSLFEDITGLRMNHAFIRPGGLSQDLPDGAEGRIRDELDALPGKIDELEDLLTQNPIWVERNTGVGILTREQCLDLGVTGPILRSAGVAHDIRKVEPYCGIEQYDFEVHTVDTCDAYGRFLIRVREMRESIKIARQVLDRLPGGPIMVADKKIAWPAQLALGPDGLGNAASYIGRIMGQSMESLIHHFKLVTEGFEVPAGTVYQPVESPRGELGYHVTSAGDNMPYRVRVRDPSFIHIGTIPAATRGLQIADVIAALASLDPVMGGVDR
jgi:NADH-quinone oxidoreductase subunit D